MRNVALIAAALAVVVACGGEEPKPVAPPPPPTDTAPPPPPPPPPEPPKPSLADMEKADLGAALDGLNGHDAKKFASVYADDGVIAAIGLQEVRGKDAIEKNMQEWFDTFKDIKLGFSRVWAKNDTMVIEWVINGKHHGELFGVKGTEQPIGHYGLSLVTFTPDGKVAREDRYGELGAVMTQVGGSKAKPRPIPSVPAAPDTFTGGNADTEAKNVELAKSALASLEPKGEAKFLGLLTDDIEHDGLFALETTKGKDEAKKFHKAFTTAFPDAKFDVSRAWGFGDDWVIVESMLKATQKGPLGPIGATKRPIAIHIADVFKIKDGKIARVWTYQNSLELQEQLGLFDVKAPGTIPATPPAKK
ncbi:MAG TPA: ester cyclase [Labilithrix sp.]